MPNIHSSLPNVQRPAIPSFREATKRSPEGTANALLPIAHAMGAGFVTFCGVGLISIGVHWPLKIPLIAAGSAMILVMCLSGWWMVRNEVLWSVERIMGDDLNKDGTIGPPIQATHFEMQTGPNSIRFGQVNLPPQLIIEWCRAAVEQRSLSYGSWIKRFSLPDGTQGRERYAMFRAWLTEQGYAQDFGSNKGFGILWDNDEAVGWVNGFARFRPGDGTPLPDGSPQFGVPHQHTHTRTQEWDDEGT